MKSKIAVAALMALGLSSVGAFAAAPTGANSGQVTFNGEVVDTPCNLAPGQDGTDVKVDFGQLSMSQLNAGVETAEPFSLHLENCNLLKDPADPTKGSLVASIAFNSMDVSTDPLLMTTRGSASGLGLGIKGYKLDGTVTPLKGLTSLGNNELKFTAIAKKAVAATNVTAGDFEAATNFQITYN
ncbi:type 1 fimbrial protein [Salmonella enterica]|nr:type 1 fimbrial protein [Salmonella enterica subsp. enterica serovar Minnesota]EGO7252386.1 type 1 fimbrial protein [Salmonella enterica]